MEGAVASRPERRQDLPALGARSLCEAFQMTATERSGEVALRTLGGGIEITFGEYADRVRRLAAGLHALGVSHGDTVGLMLSNRPEFHLIDTAAIHLGAIPFSIYNTSSAEQIAYLLSNAGNGVMVAEAAFLDRLQAAIRAAGGVEHLVVLDAPAEGAIAWSDLEAAEGDGGFDFEASWHAVGPQDLLTLIYTSGTTGPPKGVQLTHANELAECRGIEEVARWRPGGAVVSFLPHAHIADRGLSHYAQMVWGHTVTCCPDLTQVFAHVADCHPTFLGAVPRVWEKLKAALESQFDGATREALARALPRVRADPLAGPDPADEERFGAIRAKLGLERCEWYMIGAAPTPLEVLEFFAAIGIPICEVWGMSETTSIATLVPPGNVRLGTVGPPIPGVQAQLADDGELLVAGETIMAGYRGDPQRTAETIDADGWLHSGDIATVDDAGFFTIVDRKKELIINAGGKNMSPVNIESQLKSSSALIGQAIAIGDRRPYNVALIVLDPDAAGAFAAERGLPDASPQRMASDPVVLEQVSAAVERANSHLSRVEQIKRFKILPCDWPPAGDELTPTMKLKRKPIAEKYAAEIEALYAA